METMMLTYPSQWLAAVFYAMPRMLAMFSVLPMFNRQALPGLLRVGTAFAFSVFVVPSLVDQSMNVTMHGTRLLAVVLKESAIGFFLGFLVALPLWAMDIMGAYIDNQRGASIAATINPLTGHDTSPLGELFSQAALVYLLMTGGLLLVLELVYASYQAWPVYQMLPKFSDQMPTVLLGLMDRLMWLAVLLSAPVIFSMFLAEVGLGIVSRFVPQLQVFFLAMPVKSAIAIFVFSVYVSSLFGYLNEEYIDFVPRALDTIRSLLVRGAT
jgi:type III secretion protein T